MSTIASTIPRSKTDQSNIDLTPMLDVVFILLIFFVVTASFVSESTLGIVGQQNTQNIDNSEETRNILLYIDGNDQLFFNGERIEIAALRSRVAQQKSANPDVSVIINPAGNSVANSLVTVMNRVLEAGVVTISVME